MPGELHFLSWFLWTKKENSLVILKNQRTEKHTQKETNKKNTQKKSTHRKTHTHTTTHTQTEKLPAENNSCQERNPHNSTTKQREIRRPSLRRRNGKNSPCKLARETACFNPMSARRRSGTPTEVEEEMNSTAKISRRVFSRNFLFGVTSRVFFSKQNALSYAYSSESYLA